jgi:hypothetical protein
MHLAEGQKPIPDINGLVRVIVEGRKTKSARRGGQ